MSLIDLKVEDFIKKLSSNEPVPGGGGAAALTGAAAAALASMVANFTSGKKKYAQFQQDIERILTESEGCINNMLTLIDEDAAVFEPLSVAYSIPKDDPNRSQVMESALEKAASVPMKILRETQVAVAILEELGEKGSRMLISDVGVAAAACSCAARSAVMNVYINTKLMESRDKAELLNKEAAEILNDCVDRCEKLYNQVLDQIK